MSKPTLPILVVEDDDALLEAIVDTLHLAGYETLTAKEGRSALHILKQHKVALVISDAQMQPMDGYALFAALKQKNLVVPFILMTAYGELDKAVEMLRAGAAHYLQKPFEPDVLLDEVARCIGRTSDASAAINQVEAATSIIAESKVMKALLALLGKVALSDASVFLHGESGVGKEVLARFLHQHSPRATGPFVAVNCAAIPEHLLESTLFGHEKGAFTGASQSFVGKFEQAQGGTLLLDEISEMPLQLQAKLLRVLQERELERLGSQRAIRLDIRVISTSNRHIEEEVAAGRFREDLYFRLNVFPVSIPPLRERKEDILPLAKAFLSGTGHAWSLSTDAVHCLTAHAWDGNIRELQNVMQRACVLASGGVIHAADLMLANKENKISALRSGAETVQSDIRSLERQHILDTLSSVGGVKKLAAQRLGISERTLRYKLQRYRMDDTEETALPSSALTPPDSSLSH